MTPYDWQKTSCFGLSTLGRQIANNEDIQGMDYKEGRDTAMKPTSEPTSFP